MSIVNEAPGLAQVLDGARGSSNRDNIKQRYSNTMSVKTGHSNLTHLKTGLFVSAIQMVEPYKNQAVCSS